MFQQPKGALEPLRPLQCLMAGKSGVGVTFFVFENICSLYHGLLSAAGHGTMVADPLGVVDSPAHLGGGQAAQRLHEFQAPQARARPRRQALPGGTASRAGPGAEEAS